MFFKPSVSNVRSAVLLVILATFSSALVAEESAATRSVFVEQGSNSNPTGNTSAHEIAAADAQVRSRATAGDPAKEALRLRSLNQDVWIYRAETRLLFDEDGDGFYTRLELDFDADTVFSQADVYAIVFLSLNGGDFEELTTTQVFSIFGAGSSDEYFVDADLLSGYPSGSYDVLIELYDNLDGSFVAEFGPNDSTALFDLPMEDQTIDTVIIDGPVVVISEGGGGATGALSLALLTIVTVAYRRRRKI